MAAHHHHYHHHQPPPPTPPTTPSICSCYSCCYTPTHNPPPPDSLFTSHPSFHPPLSPYHSNPHFHRQTHHYPSPQSELQKGVYCQELHQRERDLSQSNPIVVSLLSRIAALESTLHRHVSSRSLSLKEASARIIQIHFRAFLVRRSRTLRQLKDLASIKSAFIGLKSPVCFDPRSVSKKALNLLRRLDAIQGDDPMIRDGKVSVGREITRFIDSLDCVSVKKSELYSRVVKKNMRPRDNANRTRVLHSDYQLERIDPTNVGSNRVNDVVNRIDAMYNKVQGFGEDDEEDEALESQEVSDVRKNGISRFGNINSTNGHNRDQAKKKVSFAEKRYVYRIPSRHGEQSMGASNSDDRSDLAAAKIMLQDDMGWEAVEVDGAQLNDKFKHDEAISDEEVSSKSSDDGERSPTSSARSPVRTETGNDHIGRKNNVKLVEQRH